jgi:hypothetical protein
MPDFTKSPPELLGRFDEVVARLPDVERRLTFGYPCLYVGGNMVSGLHRATWFVRLGAEEAAVLLGIDDARKFEPMPGRPMTGYVVMPPAIIADDAAVLDWVERSIAFGRTLPPKASKAKAGSAKTGTGAA